MGLLRNISAPEGSTSSDDYPPSSSSTSSIENESLLPSLRPSKPKPSYLPWQASSPRAIITILFAIIFVLCFGAKIMVIPATRIQEDITCHYYYNGLEGEAHIGFEQEIPEEMCKGAQVQESMNVLLAGLGMISCIPALATTVAYGALADRIGRRPVFALSMTGMVLAGLFNLFIMACWRVLPLRLIWISPIFLLIGGGDAVVNMMFFAIANDITSDKNRSTVFLLGGIGGLVAEITGPAVAAFLMLRSLWLPFITGMGLLIFGTALIMFIPETLGMKPTLSSDDLPKIIDSPEVDNISFYTALRSRFANILNGIREYTRILHSLPIIILLVAFLVGPFGKVGADMALRYISNRYHWQLREVGFILSLQAVVTIILIIGILPALSHYLLTHRSYTPTGKDLLLAKASAVFLTVGALSLAAAPTIGLGIAGLLIWTLGNGFSAIVRSLITTLVDQHHVGRLFAIIAVIELVCYMAASPMQAGLYHLGLKYKGAWEGLPYFSLAVVNVISGIAVFVFEWLSRKEFNEGAIRLGDDDVERVNGGVLGSNSRNGRDEI